MKPSAGKVNVGVLFVLLQVLLYAVFLTLDLTGGNFRLSNYIKFFLILLCFCYAFFCAGKGIIFLSGTSSERLALRLIQAALLFTLISDYFILLKDYYLYGVLTFIVAQQLYTIRMRVIKEYCSQTINSTPFLNMNAPGKALKYPDKYNMPPVWKYLILLALQLILTGAVCFLLLTAGVILEPLVPATVFYFLCIVTNVIQSILLAHQKPVKKRNVMFAVGMFLFLLCDINVGLFNLTSFISLPQQIYQPMYELSSLLMWTFYAPAQVLIALSATDRNPRSPHKGLLRWF